MPIDCAASCSAEAEKVVSVVRQRHRLAPFDPVRRVRVEHLLEGVAVAILAVGAGHEHRLALGRLDDRATRGDPAQLIGAGLADRRRVAGVAGVGRVVQAADDAEIVERQAVGRVGRAYNGVVLVVLEQRFRLRAALTGERECRRGHRTEPGPPISFPFFIDTLVVPLGGPPPEAVQPVSSSPLPVPPKSVSAPVQVTATMPSSEDRLVEL